eukprot:4334237-Pyramimonas_sp.AAC.1
MATTPSASASTLGASTSIPVALPGPQVHAVLLTMEGVGFRPDEVQEALTLMLDGTLPEVHGAPPPLPGDLMGADGDASAASLDSDFNQEPSTEADLRTGPAGADGGGGAASAA